MNRLLLITSAIVSAMVLMGNAHERMPVSVVSTSVATSLTEQGNKLIFEENGVSIVRLAGSDDSDFDNLYVVRMPHKSEVPLFAETLGKVIHFEPYQFALMRIDEPQKVEELSQRMHLEGTACGAMMRLGGDAMVQNVTAVGEPIVPVTTDLAEVRTMINQVSADRISTMIGELSSITTRHHSSPTGKAMASLLKEKYLAVAIGRSDVTVEFFDHGSKTPQNSIIVRIIGKTLPDEIVILGSHIDSVNMMGGSSSRSPGADDNASGTSTNFEIFRLLMANGIHPDRTIEIHGYAAEEMGLVGSQDMAQKYKAAGKNVVTMVQHDMNLFKAAGAPDKIWFVTNNTLDTFNTALGALIDQYVGVQWGKKALSGGDSDHTSWRRQGYVTSFPFEDPASYNHKIHTENDTFANANAMTQVVAFAKLGLAYLTHYAGI